MSRRFQFSLKGLLVTTATFALLAWMASLVWPSHQPPTAVKLIVTPMLCLVFFRLWVLSRS